MELQTLTDKEFEEKVIGSDRPVLVDFWATWCMPCTQMALVLEKLVAENDSIAVYKMNIDENAIVPAQFNIMSIPTLILFHKKEVMGRWMGLTDKDTLAAWIQEKLTA